MTDSFSIATLSISCQLFHLVLLSRGRVRCARDSKSSNLGTDERIKTAILWSFPRGPICLHPFFPCGFFFFPDWTSVSSVPDPSDSSDPSDPSTSFGSSTSLLVLSPKRKY